LQRIAFTMKIKPGTQEELFSFAFSSYLIMDVPQPQCTSERQAPPLLYTASLFPA